MTKIRPILRIIMPLALVLSAVITAALLVLPGKASLEVMASDEAGTVAGDPWING